MNQILQSILNKKQFELETAKRNCPASLLEKQLSNCSPARSFSSALLNGSGIIAEYKRKSPSGGFFSHATDPSTQSFAYELNGASSISVLTDFSFFGGSVADLEAVKHVVQIPVLRKEFILDEYQILESRIFGADAVLLIASCLSPERAGKLCDFAHEIGLEVLLEFHTMDEIVKFSSVNADCFGINNRNLNTLATDLKTSLELIHHLPFGKPRISESGIKCSNDIEVLRQAGFQGFLIGDLFLQEGGIAVLKSLSKLKEGIC
ncbi:MAG: indole-3-glycerol phosphate synthase TrpC [Flavobacteriales bacterium]